MGLKRVTGNIKKAQKLVDVEIVSALKGNNQTNPRSGGVTLVFGQTTTTNMPAKSIENTGGIRVIGNLGQGHEAQNVHDPSGIAPAVREMHGKVTKIATGMNTQDSMKETSGQLTLLPYQNTTSCVRDFLARVSALLESEGDLKILGAHSSLKLSESYGLRDLSIYSLRMLRDSSPMMKGIHSKPLSERWMNWGMTVNGKCLTARISESPKTGKGCSLSDILEENPDQKYFLSEKTIKKMANFNQRKINKGYGFRVSVHDMDNDGVERDISELE